MERGEFTFYNSYSKLILWFPTSRNLFPTWKRTDSNSAEQPRVFTTVRFPNRAKTPHLTSLGHLPVIVFDISSCFTYPWHELKYCEVWLNSNIVLVCKYIVQGNVYMTSCYWLYWLLISLQIPIVRKSNKTKLLS